MLDIILDVDVIKKCPIVTTGRQFSELCAPIFQTTPINYIGLCRIYHDGTRSYLMSDPVWSSEVLLKNDYHLAGTEDNLLASSDASFHPWFLSSMFSLNQETENLFKDCIRFNYGNGITLIERGKDYVEFFHICADGGYEKVNDYLLQVDMLWNVVLYLREAISKSKDVKRAYDIRYAVKQHLTCQKLSEKTPSQAFPLEQYYLGGLFGDVYFTKREIDCLVLSFRHLSSKQQVAYLGLSVRSVECYLEGIRQKVACRTRQELILMLARNNAFLALERNWGLDTASINTVR